MTNAGIYKHSRDAKAAVVSQIAKEAKVSERTVRRLMMPWRTISSTCGCGESPAMYNDISYKGVLYSAYATICERCAR